MLLENAKERVELLLMQGYTEGEASEETDKAGERMGAFMKKLLDRDERFIELDSAIEEYAAEARKDGFAYGYKTAIRLLSDSIKPLDKSDTEVKL